METFTITYISSDTPDREFKSYLGGEDLADVLRKFYDLCTTVDDTLTIRDIKRHPEAVSKRIVDMHDLENQLLASAYYGEGHPIRVAIKNEIEKLYSEDAEGVGLIEEEQPMNNLLNLFSVRADYMGCEYGSLFIVAADNPTTAQELVKARLDRGETDMGVTIDSCERLGTTTLFDCQRVVDQFAT